MAEARRFELRLGVTPLSVFKTDPFSRLGTPPWCSIQGLNLGHLSYKGSALTAELMEQAELL